MRLALSVLTLLSTLPLMACLAPVNPAPDEDGLPTEFELSIGPDPEQEATDADGFSDAVEVLTYFSPRNADDHPYEGEYTRGPLMGSDEWDSYTEDAGWDENDISKGWKVTDQHGEESKLKRFFGNVILIDMGAEWCGPCRQATETLDEEYQDRKEDGFVVIQLLTDGLSMGDRNPDGDRWIDEFDITFPVIEDGEFHAAKRYVPAGSFGIPNYTVIDRNHEIHTWFQEGGQPPLEVIADLLDEDPPSVDYSLPENAEELYEALSIDPNSWIY